MQLYGASLQAASLLSDISTCDAERWLEAGRAHSHGPHGQFAKLVSELQPAARTPMTMTGTFGLAARNGTGHGGHCGNGSANGNGNGQHVVEPPQPLQLTRFADL